MTQVPSDHEAEPQEALADLTKKLRKRERRLLQRLQKAQTARAKAVERLNRAQARLEKRTARLQRLEERLSLVRQQLQTLESLTRRAPVARSVDEPALSSHESKSALPAVPEEEKQETAHQGAASLAAPSIPADTVTQDASAEASQVASGNPMISELQALTNLLLEEGRREEQLRASWERSGLSSQSSLMTAEETSVSPSEQTPTAPESEGPIWPVFERDAAKLAEQREPDWVNQLGASASSSAPASQSEPDTHSTAEEAGILIAREEPDNQPAFPSRGARPASQAAERSPQAALYGFDEPPELPEGVESDEEEAAFSPMTPAVLASSLLPASPAELVREARAAAEAAEEAARLAIERAALAAARLEQLPSGRHLVQELAEVEQAVAQANHAAEVAQTTARAVERWAQALSAPAGAAIENDSTSLSAQGQEEARDSSSESSESAVITGSAEEAEPSGELRSTRPGLSASAPEQGAGQPEEASGSEAEQADPASPSQQDNEEGQRDPANGTEKIDPPTVAQEKTAEESSQATPDALEAEERGDSAEESHAQAASSSQAASASIAIAPPSEAPTGSEISEEEVMPAATDSPIEQAPEASQEESTTLTPGGEAGHEQEPVSETSEQAENQNAAPGTSAEAVQTPAESQRAEAEAG